MIKKYLPFLCLFIYVLVTTVGAFAGGLWGAVGIVGALLFFIAVWIADKKTPLPATPIALLALATLGVFAAEIPFSSHVDISTHVWLQLTTIFLPLLLLTSPRLQTAAASPVFARVVGVAMLIGAVALGCELASGGMLIHLIKKPTVSLTEYNRGVAHLVILAFPVVAALWIEQHKKLAIVLALLLLFMASLTESHTAKLALIIGAVCTLAAFYRSVWVRNILALGAVALMNFPFYAQKFFTTHYATVEAMHPSWGHRIEIWDYLSYRIMEHPVTGWGLGTTHTLDYARPHGDLYIHVTENAPHAHNFITEIWVETGIIGLGFGLAFLLLTLRAAYALPQSLRPFALGGWAAAVVTSLFGFDFWNDALWSAFALSAFAFGLLRSLATGMLQQQPERKPNLVNAQLG